MWCFEMIEETRKKCVWHSVTYRKHSFVSGRSVSGFAEVTDKEMGNFIVCCYLENGFCEYWAGWI